MQFAAAVDQQERLGSVSASIMYGLKELARRAGVNSKVYSLWTVRNEGVGWLDVYVGAQKDKCIRFPLMEESEWKEVQKGKWHTRTAQWMHQPASHISALIPDFKVPFAPAERANGQVLFQQTSPNQIKCNFALPEITLLILSRFEESLPHATDLHGRFEAKSSIAGQEGFLKRPIVDEYGMAFEQALSALLPEWKPEKRKLRVKISYDVDEIGIPFSLRTAVGHTLRRNKISGTIQDLFSLVSRLEPAYLQCLRETVSLAVENAVPFAVNWKASEKGKYDTGYNPRDPRILSFISELRELGAEIGIHPSYKTYDSESLFKKEVTRLREVLRETNVGGRQDFLRWNPKNWRVWETCQLAYDNSLGFADQIGFRAGTAYPYRPWWWQEERELNLLEIPLQAMDSTLFYYCNMNAEQALHALRDCINRCRIVGGVFSLAWHNTTFMNSTQTNVYKQILRELAGTEGFNGRNRDSAIN